MYYMEEIHIEEEAAIVGIVREHCCGVRGKITVLVSARLLQPTALLRSGLCHINFSPIKNPPLIPMDWCKKWSCENH